MATTRVRFGTFDFDPSTRELRRDGTPIRLQPQPAQVLATLLARAGDIVTREELRAAVWTPDTFVDFDRNLNFCIAQIRSALADSAESPIYIKTIPKRGYQFIAPVASPGTPSAPPPPPPQHRTHRKLLILAAAAIAVAAIFLLLPHKVQSSPTRIAVSGFDNLTGDPAFDNFTNGLQSAVVAELTNHGAGKYAIIGNAALLRKPKTDRDLTAIHSSLNVAAVVLAEIQRTPEGIHVFAQLIGLPEQSHRKAIRIHTAESDPVKAQSELAKRILSEFAKPLTFAANR